MNGPKTHLPKKRREVWAIQETSYMSPIPFCRTSGSWKRWTDHARIWEFISSPLAASMRPTAAVDYQSPTRKASSIESKIKFCAAFFRDQNGRPRKAVPTNTLFPPKRSSNIFRHTKTAFQAGQGGKHPSQHLLPINPKTPPAFETASGEN